MTLVDRLRVWERGQYRTDPPGMEAVFMSDDAKEAADRIEQLEQMDRAAGTHVESVICMRSRYFTGDPPYVGWKGLGLALRQDYDRIEALESALREAQEALYSIAIELELPRPGTFDPVWVAKDALKKLSALTADLPHTSPSPHSEQS